MSPSWRHMALAALVSAFAWVDARLNRLVRGPGYHKAYLFPQRDAVLADPVMAEGLALTRTGSWYHQQKDMWTRFLEVAHGDRGAARAGEEMQSKYFAFVAVGVGVLAGAGASLLAVALAVALGRLV